MKPLNALYGPARSGTTWIGSVFNAAPEVAYRFEPIHRLRHHEICQAFNRPEGPFDRSHLEQLYTLLLRSTAAIDKPPFFRKALEPGLGKSLLWPLARKLPVVDRLYSSLYSSSKERPLVFKEVALTHTIPHLVAGGIPVAYVARHPYATIMSEIRGQQAGLMPSGRASVVASLLEKYAPNLYEQYGDSIERMEHIEKQTLIWLMEIQFTYQSLAAADQGTARIYTYEEICTDPLPTFRQMFSLFGIPLGTEVENYLDRLYASSPAAAKRRPQWMSYFSIMKNPAHSVHQWQQRVDRPVMNKIMGFLEGNTAFEYFANRGSW
ncbi:sulfotransferase domain-containing protein [Microbulbifer sediminum]|uniref:sulfotransferase domain-containing protein n=1 Tax=Microbulbifer sediminum TaxID=2904250 RepID=UPI001F00F993